MSRNAPTLTPTPKIDRRIRRTRDRLGNALMELLQEKTFDSITVQDVLDRAGVGRSTFYVHYRDKEDLFVSDVEEFLGGMATMLIRHGDSSDRVAPVRELFAHVAEMRRLYDAVLLSGRIHDFLELGQGQFARAIEQRLAERPRASGIPAERRAAVAQALAGALMSLTSWWLDRGMPASPAEMDDLYHRMVWRGVR
jgi:AcrR family transcriptional regulator